MIIFNYLQNKSCRFNKNIMIYFEDSTQISEYLTSNYQKIMKDLHEVKKQQGKYSSQFKLLKKGKLIKLFFLMTAAITMKSNE